MDEQLASPRDNLLYWLFLTVGVVLTLISFLSKAAPWNGLFLNVGATLISTSLLAFLYQHFGGRSLRTYLSDIRQSLTVAQRSFEIGVLNLWRERRLYPREHWGPFTAGATKEVWLLGIAALGYAEDAAFEAVVAAGTKKGCSYRFLILDPNSQYAKQIDQKEGGGGQVQGRISRACVRFQQIVSKHSSNLGKVEFKLYDDIPYVSLVRADQQMLITSYLSYLPGDDLPILHIQNAPNGIFSKYETHFTRLWNDAKQVTANEDSCNLPLAGNES